MRNTNAPTDTVAGRVRQAMAEREVSGSELARRLGVKQPYLSRRLTGSVEFRAEELARIAAWLDVPVTRFLPTAEAAR